MGSTAPHLLAVPSAAGLHPHEAWNESDRWRHAPAVGLTGVADALAAPAVVRALWNRDWLLVEFVCDDASIVSPGMEDGLDHFRLGDVVEVFVAPSGGTRYAEFHATPRGRKSSYFFDDYRKPGPVPGGTHRVFVRGGAAAGGWRAVFGLPWEVLGALPHEAGWDFFAARYDYDRPGGKEVLSSWPHQSDPADFHRRADYGRLVLCP